MKRGPKHHTLTLDEFINGGKLEIWSQSCRMIYTLHDRIFVKRLCQYENAQSEVEQIFNELGLQGNPELPKAQSNIRKDRRPYQEVLTASQAKKIASLYEEEIEIAGYLF